MNNNGLDDLIVGDPDYGTLLYCTRKNDGTLHHEGNLKSSGQDIKLGAEVEISPCIVDWNEDGKFDLVVGNGEEPADLYWGHIRLYVNSGSQSSYAFPGFSKLSGGGFVIREKTPMVTVADLDYDGKKDMIIGNEKSSDYIVYRNTGSNTAPSFSQSSYITNKEKLKYRDDNGTLAVIKENYSAMFGCLYDLNSDGKLDLVSGNVYLKGVKIYYGEGGTTVLTGESGVTGSSIPVTCRIKGDRCRIQYTLAESRNIILSLFTLQGKNVAKIESGFMHQGAHTFVLDISDVGAGTYVLALEEGVSKRAEKKILTFVK